MKLLRWLCAAAVLASCSCNKQPDKVPVGQQAVQEAPQLASQIPMGEAKWEPQLLSGFYGIEGNSWRWTARQFSVALRPPAGAAQNGAVLEFDFTVPDVVVQKLKSVTLSASLGAADLGSETYSKSGPAVYKKDIPATALGGDSVKVQFSLNKAMQPNGDEHRELGVVANSVKLTAK